MAWRPHHQKRDPVFYLWPIVAFGILGEIWPAFRDFAHDAEPYIFAGLILFAALLLAWALWGPRIGTRDTPTGALWRRLDDGASDEERELQRSPWGA